MFYWGTFVIFGCLIHVSSLEEPSHSRCGEDYNILKKLVELEEEVKNLKTSLKGKFVYIVTITLLYYYSLFHKQCK
jgi:hypothetical protein